MSVEEFGVTLWIPIHLGKTAKRAQGDIQP